MWQVVSRRTRTGKMDFDRFNWQVEAQAHAQELKDKGYYYVECYQVRESDNIMNRFAGQGEFDYD